MTKLLKASLRKTLVGIVMMTTIFSLSGITALIPVAQAATIVDGDVIQNPSAAGDAQYDVYIVKIAGANKYKRLVLNPQVFASYGHLKWENVKAVTSEEMNSFKTSAMVRVETDPKVLALAPNGDTGSKSWLNVPAADYIAAGGTWDQVYTINAIDAANYAAAGDLTTQAQVVTFLTAGALPGVAATPTPAPSATPVAGGLSVALSSVTPAGTNVPANATAAAADVVMTKVNFTAGATDATITGLKVTRGGLSQNAAISSVKVFDGATQVGNSQNLNSSNQAAFNNISVLVPAGTTKTLSLAASLTASATYNGNIITLSIANATDITTASTVSGTFPIAGSQFALTTGVTIGTATLYNGSSGTRNTTDLTVDSDAKDVRFTQVKIQAGSGEAITVSQITAIKNGTASNSDVKDIKLVNDTTGATLATLASLNGDGRAVFSNLTGVTATKGNYVELSVIATVNNSGTGRTIAFDLYDGSAYTIMVTGQTYGFGITPVRSDFCTVTTGVCVAQTINQGYLTVQKSASTPATGNIALGGSAVILAAFDYTAAGEPVNVTSTQLTITPASGGSAVDYTNVTIYDPSGAAVAGPADGTTTGANTAQTLTFTDSYQVPVGTTIYTVKANVSSSAAANEKVTISMPINTIVAKGANSNKTTHTTSTGSTVPPAAAVTANQMTIQGPALAVVTAATPIVGSVVVNAQDQVFAYIDLNASSSGEDLKITSVKVADAITGSDYSGVNNLELWGAADNTSSSTVARLATSNSTAVNAATTTFTFLTPLKVKKGTISRLTLKADVVSTTGTSHTFDVANVAENVVVTGYATGSTLTETYSGTGQAQTVASVGTLKVEVGADRPQAAQFVAGTTGNEMMTYKFTTAYEPVDVTDFYIATTSGSANADIAGVKLYVNGVQIGVTTGYTLNASGIAHVVLSNGTFVISKDGSSTLSVKVDLSDKASLTSGASLEIGLGDADGNDGDWGAEGAYSNTSMSYLMVATGQASGTAITPANINSTGVSTGLIAASYVEYLYDGVLTVVKNASSPSGTQTAGSNQEVLRLDLTAAGDDIQVDELELCVSGTATDVDGTGSVTIKSSDLGTTYATLTNAVYDTYWDTAKGAGTYYQMDPGVADASCMSFGVTGATYVTVGVAATNTAVAFTNTITVGAGTTKTIKVFGDTTGAGTTKTLQLSVKANGTAGKAATTSGLSWEDVQNNAAVDTLLTKNLPVSGGSLLY